MDKAGSVSVGFAGRRLQPGSSGKTIQAINGVQGLRAVNHGNAWSVYFPDPEGNTIEAFLDTPWHVPQPHGEALDLDKSDADIIAQTEAACSQDPDFMPRPDWDRVHAKKLS